MSKFIKKLIPILRTDIGGTSDGSTDGIDFGDGYGVIYNNGGILSILTLE